MQSPVRRRALQIALAALTLVVVAPSVSAAAKPNLPWEGAATPRVKAGRIVVTFRPGVSAAERRSVHAIAGARRVAHGSAFTSDVVRLAPGVGVAGAMRRYRADPRVVDAEADRFAVLSETPNDPLFPSQWGLHNTGQEHDATDSRPVNGSSAGTDDADVDAPEAWGATTSGGEEVVVAVLDTGVDIDHPDLDGSIWVNAAEQAGLPDVDDDGNGYVDDVHGWDFQQDDEDPSPGTGEIAWHGTHVAGIVAAEHGGNEGVAGVCETCRIMPLRFDLSLGQEVEAIEYAVANGADVINMSFGSPIWSSAERAAIRAAGDEGVLSVVSAGNSSLDNDIGTYIDFSFSPDYPASYTIPEVLSVAASNDEDRYAYDTECASSAPRWRCAFTSWGRNSVDVAAPGVDIVSTVPVGRFADDYLFSNGTSMAAPLVAGIAGLVKNEHPDYEALELKNALMNSVDTPGTLRMLSSWADLIGIGKSPIDGQFTRTQGRVNALNALTAPITNATPQTDGNIDGAVGMKSTKRGRVAWPADVNDVFRKRLVAGNRYRVVLDGPAGKDMDLFVWTPPTKEIFQYTNGCFLRDGRCPALKAVSSGITADERVTFGVSKTGTFFIHVQGWYSRGGYTLTVRRV